MRLIKSLLILLMLSFTLFSFISCDDDEESSDGSSSAVKSVLESLQDALNDNDYDAFLGLWSSSSNTATGSAALEWWNSNQPTYANMSLSNIEVSASETSATATADDDVLGIEYSFSLVKSGSSWYLSKWEDNAESVPIADKTVLFK